MKNNANGKEKKILLSEVCNVAAVHWVDLLAENLQASTANSITVTHGPGVSQTGVSLPLGGSTRKLFEFLFASIHPATQGLSRVSYLKEDVI